MNKKVWFPEESLLDCGSETSQMTARGQPEHPKKRGGRKITRRTTPTVDFSALESQRKTGDCARSSAAEHVGENERESYSTIEKRTYKRNASGLECASKQTLSGPGTSGAPSDFCGWETDNTQQSRQSHTAPLPRKTPYDRSSLCTPCDGYRSGLSSRTGSRSGPRGKGSCYVFQHFSDSRSHIQDYCAHYSYTALSAPRVDETVREVVRDQHFEEGGKKREKNEPKAHQSRHQNTSKQESNSDGRVESGKQGGTSFVKHYLQHLASRLGVGESIQRQSSLSRPTPPSISKGGRRTADLLLSPTDEKQLRSPRTEEENAQDQAMQPSAEDACEEPSPDGSDQASQEITAPTSRPKTSAPLELPRLLYRGRERDKILSTTSVSKYLQISSRPKHSLSLELGEEESVALSGDETSGSGNNQLEESQELATDPAACTGTHIVSSTKNTPHPKTSIENGYNHPVVLARSSRDTQPVFVPDEAARNKVLAQKAQALGLLSRDWAKIAHTTTRTGSNNGSCGSSHMTRGGISRPATRSRDTTVSRPPTRGAATASTSSRSDKGSAPPHPPNVPSTPRDSHKMEQLRNIYEPTRSTQTTDQQSRRGSEGGRESYRPYSKSSSREITRSNTQHPRRSSREKKSGQFSRLNSRGKRSRRTPGLSHPSLEPVESQYWKEVGHGQSEQHLFQVRNGTELRVDSRQVRPDITLGPASSEQDQVISRVQSSRLARPFSMRSRTRGANEYCRPQSTAVATTQPHTYSKLTWRLDSIKTTPTT